MLTNSLMVPINSNFVEIRGYVDTGFSFDMQARKIQGSVMLSGSNISEQTVGGKVSITGMVDSVTDISITGETGSAGSFAAICRGMIPVQNIEDPVLLKTFNLNGTILVGTIDLLAPKALVLGDANGATIDIAESAPVLHFVGGNFSNSQRNFTAAGSPPVEPFTMMNVKNLIDTRVGVDGPLVNFKALSVTETTPGASAIDAPSAGTISIVDGYQGDLNLTAPLSPVYSLKNLRIGKTASGSFNVSGAVNSMSANAFDGNFSGAFGTINTLSATNLSGSFTARTIRTTNIRANVTGATFTLTEPWAANTWDLGAFSVGNSMTASTISSAGNLGNVKMMYMYYCHVYAGAAGTYVFGQHPTMSDFTAHSVIKSLTVDCPSHHYIHFIDNDIEAFSILAARIGHPETQNGGTPFGFAAIDIGRLTIEIGTRELELSNITSAEELVTALDNEDFTPEELGDVAFLLALTQ